MENFTDLKPLTSPTPRRQVFKIFLSSHTEECFPALQKILGQEPGFNGKSTRNRMCDFYTCINVICIFISDI